MKTAITTAALLLVSAAPAGAQTTTLTIDRGALRADGIRVAAIRPATLDGSRLRIGLDHGGGFALRRSARTVRLTRLRSTPRSISALVAGRRIAAITVSPARRLTWTRRGAAAVARRLGLRRLRHRRLGTLSAQAPAGRRDADAPAPATQPSGGSSPSSSSTASAGGAPQTTPITDEPPVLARPATAVPITGATVNWHVRDSFIQYINSAVGPGEGTNVSRGATKGPATVRPGSPMALVYDFGFPFAAGWFDAASGTSATTFTGTVNFRYSLHGIDIDAKDAEIEINGARSRAIFRFDGRQSTRPGNKRAVLVDLHLDRARTVSTSPDGKTRTYEVVPGTVARGSDSSVFAGFYEPGEEFGWIDMSFTTG